MIRVVLADDHALVREGIRRSLEQRGGMQIVAEVADGRAVVERLKTVPADVVILDLNMPEMGGALALRQIREAHPRLGVLVLSMYAEDKAAARLLRAGASGYLTKGRSTDELCDAIQKIAAGGRYVTASLAEHLLETTAAPPHERLTEREHQVFTLIAAGKSPSDVASELGVSASTVSTYLARIKKQLDAKTLGEIILYASRNGLL